MSRHELSDLLLKLDQRPTGAAYAVADRQLSSLTEELRPLKVAALGSFTLDPLLPYLRVEGARRGFALETYLAPYDSVTRELLDPQSGCSRFEPDALFIAQLLEDVSPALTDGFLGLDGNGIEQASRQVIGDLMGPLEAFLRRRPATVAVHNFAKPPHALLGLYEAEAEDSQSRAIGELNRLLARELQIIEGAHVLDFDRLCGEIGYRRWRNENTWSLGRAPLGAEALREVARLWGGFLQAGFGLTKKCLVLDLDGCLWGGVLGEDGLGGIALGHEAPGNLYRRFQQAVLQLHRQGVVLAVNSKNNVGEVEEAFARHPDMVIRREHVSSLRANWQPKPRNMEEIAHELDLSLDSFVFFDDSPAERELMRQTLPQVETLEVPDRPAAYLDCLLGSRWFDKLTLTKEDRQRGSLYRARARRQELQAASVDLESYLKSLGTVVDIRPCDETSFPRVHALLQKTNQFNLTTRRHSQAQLRKLMEDPQAAVQALSARDRFGDNGLVGVGIVRLDGDGQVAVLDTLLLSCRVIGRGIETAFLSRLAAWCRERSCRLLRGEFRPTAKNEPAASFFEEHEFRPAGETADGGRLWELDLGSQETPFPGYIELAEEPGPRSRAVGET